MHNKFIIFCGLIVVISLSVFLTFFRKDQLDIKKLAEGLNKQCLKDSSDRCFSSFFTSFAKDHPLTTSRSLLQELQRINSRTTYCHSIAHAISIAEVEKDPSKWIEVFNEVPDSECSYGYFHGVVEGKYRFSPDFVVDNNIINQVCLKVNSEGGHRSCAHAFGHVLLVQERADLNKALGFCEEIDPGIKNSCFQGVFMENIQRDNLEFHALTTRVFWDRDYLNKEKIVCGDYRDAKRVECWRSLGPAILLVANRDIRFAVSVCKEAPDYFSRRACSREVLGQNMINQLAGESQVEDITNNCKLFADKGKEYEECVKDVVGYVVLTSKTYMKQMTVFCDNAGSDIQAECLKIVNTYGKPV